MTLNIRATTLALLFVSSAFGTSITKASAQGTTVVGPRGRLGYGRGAYYGPNGGYVRGRGAAGLNASGTAGFAAGAHAAMGPNGSTFHGRHFGVFKQGAGFYNSNRYNVQGANGNNLSHYARSGYNAQTGGDFANGGNQGTINGKAVGDQYQLTGQKGQGMQGTLNTDNHGDYNVQIPPGGGKPILTETQPPAATPQ